MDDEGVYGAVRQHVADFWSGHAQEEFRWTLGPIGGQLPRFRVRRIAPKLLSDPWVYVTVGAWEADRASGKEFFLLSPVESPRHVETLAMTAHFHADVRHRLSIGQAVDIGRPWLDESAADHLLVSLPYPYGPVLEHCDAAGLHVRFLWLVPITESEARCGSSRGVEVLEQLLESSDVDVIDPGRRSLV